MIPIIEIINRLRNALSFISKPIIKQKANNNTLIFRFKSENVVPVLAYELIRKELLERL